MYGLCTAVYFASSANKKAGLLAVYSLSSIVKAVLHLPMCLKLGDMGACQQLLTNFHGLFCEYGIVVQHFLRKFIMLLFHYYY